MNAYPDSIMDKPTSSHSKSGITFLIIHATTTLGLLLLVPLLICLCLALTRTLTWRKRRARQQRRVFPPKPSTLEGQTISAGVKNIESESESELDPTDSADEAESKLREERRRDLALTTPQYFWKQMRRIWKDERDANVLRKAKEREDRKRLAKAVAKELEKLQRKREDEKKLEKAVAKELAKIEKRRARADAEREGYESDETLLGHGYVKSQKG